MVEWIDPSFLSLPLTTASHPMPAVRRQIAAMIASEPVAAVPGDFDSSPIAVVP